MANTYREGNALVTGKISTGARREVKGLIVLEEVCVMLKHFTVLLCANAAM